VLDPGAECAIVDQFKRGGLSLLYYLFYAKLFRDLSYQDEERDVDQFALSESGGETSIEGNS
jgi:hypothetical protein